MLQSFQSRKEIAKRHPYFYIDQKRKDQIIMIVISFICEEFFFSCRVEIAPHFGPLETWTLQSTSSSSLLVFGHFFIVRKIHNDIPFLLIFFCGTFITRQNAHVLQSVFWEEERLFTIFTNAKQLWDSKSAMMNDAK